MFGRLIALSLGSLSTLGLSWGTGYHHKPLPVKIVDTKTTAEMLPAASQSSSMHHQAVFVISAYASQHRPVADAPVTFYIGNMTPGSGIPPTSFVATNTSQAQPYVKYASAYTNRLGQAVLVLKGQKAQTMEMVGVKVGNFSSYNPTTHKLSAALDAWWTTPSSTPTAPYYDTLTVNPFMIQSHKASIKDHVVARHEGKVVPGVTLHAFVNAGTPQASEMTTTTNSGGQASFTVPLVSQTTVVAIKSQAQNSTEAFTGGIVSLAQAPKN